MIIGLDFDGTCVTHEFPNIGRELPGCIEVLKERIAMGDRIVLNTMRSDSYKGRYLTDAVAWLKERGIELWGINNNPDQLNWTTSPKIYAHVYIDDAALGAPLVYSNGERPAVDWVKVRELLNAL
jgi:hypothetical protein